MIIGPGQRSEPQCRYVTGQVIVERVDKGGSGSTAFLEFPVQPRGSLAGVGNAVANPHQGLYIRCPLAWGSGGVSINMLIDCGATASLMDEKVYSEIPVAFRPRLSSVKTRVTLADGRIQQCAGRIQLPLKLGAAWHTMEFLVGRWSDQAILGMAELQALGLAIDFEGMVVTKRDHIIPIQDHQGLWVSRRVLVRRTTIIPAASQGVVEACVEPGADLPRGKVVVVDPDGSLYEVPEVVPLSSIHEWRGETFPVIIQNNSEVEVELNVDLVLGQLKSLEDSSVGEEWVMGEIPEMEVVRATDVQETNDTPRSSPLGELPSHLTDLWERSVANLNEEQRGELHGLFVEYQDIFSRHNYDLGCTHLLQFSIDVGDHSAIKQAPRRMSPQAGRAADEIIGELLLHKLIEPSDSPWASPIVMVKRKDGRYRMCFDFREVNKVTLNKSAWPMPRIDQTLESLAGAEYFCTTDLTAGYHQVPMREDSKWPTAFVHRNGLYHWNRKPFGVTDGPGQFSKMMANHFRDMLDEGCKVFLDDVLIYGSTVDETLARYREFCVRIRSANLKLKPSKCSLFQKEVGFLGHVVSSRGVATDPEKIAAVQDWPVPRSRKQVRSFLGLVSYYRKFIQDCSTIAKPLTELTSPTVSFAWSERCQHAFEELKACLLKAPILGYPREDGGTMYLDTDASDVGLGIVLSQDQEDQEVVIAYASRTLSPAEVNYCVTRRELLAIIHGVQLFKSYLQMKPSFVIRTDHSSLKYLQRFKEPEGQLARWIDFLQPYSFVIEYRPGARNGNADALSRRPHPCEGKKVLL